MCSSELISKVSKVLSEPFGPLGSAGLQFAFNGRQTDTSRSCKAMDTGPVCRTVYLFTSPVPNYTAWWQRQWVWTTVPRLHSTAQRLGLNLWSPGGSLNALTIVPPSHTKHGSYSCKVKFVQLTCDFASTDALFSAPNAAVNYWRNEGRESSYRAQFTKNLTYELLMKSGADLGFCKGGCPIHQKGAFHRKARWRCALPGVSRANPENWKFRTLRCIFPAFRQPIWLSALL